MAAGQTTVGVVSGEVIALGKGVLQTMLWTKIKIVTSCILVVGVLG